MPHERPRSKFSPPWASQRERPGPTACPRTSTCLFARRALRARAFVLVAAATFLRAAEGRARAASPLEHPILFTQLPVGTRAEKEPPATGGMLRARYGDGARIVRLDPDGTLRVLTAEFESACGADVSFDGERFLFAGRRKASDRWGIFEARVDGTGTRQVISDFGNCFAPAYQSTLYTLQSEEPWYQLMFASDASAALNEYGAGAGLHLYSAKLDGTSLRRLTFNLSDDFDPAMLPDGSVVYAAWQRMDLQEGFRGRVELFAVQIDGQELMLYARGGGSRVQHMPCVTPRGDVIFVEADEVGWDGAGKLGLVGRRRPLYSYRPVPADPHFLYHSPAPLSDGTILVARRPAGGTGTHGLCLLDPETGRAQEIFDAPEYHDIHPRAVAPRPEPDGRSTVVDETKYSTGKFYCLDVGISDPDIQPHLPRSEVRRLRVLQGVPARADTPPAPLPPGLRRGIGGPGSSALGIPPIARKRILGEIPIERDGSFQIEVPADIPVQLQTLDRDGLALETCGWIWVKHRGTQGCIGCHEDQELAPENRFVEAVKKPAVRLLLPSSLRRTVDFRRDVQPILARKCALPECHGGADSKPRLTDEPVGPFSRAYAELLAPSAETQPADGPVFGKYVEPCVARTSPLVWKLLGRNTSRPWDRTYGFPVEGGPHPSGGLAEDERLTIIEWIDLGALYDGIPPADADRPIEIKEWESQ